MKRVPSVAGFIFAALHLACVVVVASLIFAARGVVGEFVLLWTWFVVLDYPLGYLWEAVDQLVKSWPDVPFLPPLANNWQLFLAPLIFFSVVGTIWWFCIGWVIGRMVTLIFTFRGSRSHVTP